MALATAGFARAEEPDSTMSADLGEVVVTATRPQVTAENGVMRVDLPAIVKDKPVTDILEALRYVPGVIEDNGVVTLGGAGVATLLLNGELTNMPVENLYRLLQSIPVERLKSVEVMYAAPAKYHVSGPAINIVLKTPRPLDGLMGQAMLGYTHKHYSSYRGGLAATYATGNWTFDVNWTLARNHVWDRELTYSNHLVGPDRTMIVDDMRGIGRNLTNLLYAAVGYKGLRITYNGQILSKVKSVSLSAGTFGDYANTSTFLRPQGYHNVALRYSGARAITVGGDFTSYTEDRNQLLTKDGAELVNARNRQSISRFHGYIDKEHILGQWKLNYGAEYQHTSDHSMQSYIKPHSDGFDEVMHEDVAKVYAGTQASLECGLSGSISVGAEYFHNGYQHSWNAVPQLGLTYFRTPSSIFQLNFTSERSYPQYWEMHGAAQYVNEYSVVLGNPALQPSMRYAGQFSYILRQKYVATLYVNYARKYSVQLPYQMPQELHLLFQTVNFDFSRRIGLQVIAPTAIGRVLETEWVANISHIRQKASHYHDISFDNGRWSVYGAMNNTLKLSERWPLSLSVDLSYVSGQIQGPGRFNDFWRVDAGVKWQFGRGRCCELDVKCDDLFNTWNPKLTIRASGQDYRMNLKDMSRQLKITLVWRFNGFKPKDTDTDTSRLGISQ